MSLRIEKPNMPSFWTAMANFHAIIVGGHLENGCGACAVSLDTEHYTVDAYTHDDYLWVRTYPKACAPDADDPDAEMDGDTSWIWKAMQDN